jgi:TonB family protein
MRGVALVLAGIACAVGVAANAAPGPGGGAGRGAKRPDVSVPLEGVVTKPEWVQTPNGEDFATYFPPVAQLLGLGGRIVMNCQVSSTGTMENCVVTEETPKGMGFGDAALKISQFFRMKPMSVDGVAVAGTRINIPIRFAGPDRAADESAGSPDDSGAPPSPKALELARQIVGTGLGPQRMHDFAADTARKWVGERFAGVSLTEQQQAALEAYVQAVAASGPKQAEVAAQRYAHEFTEQQLSEIATFLESPTGQAWTQRSLNDANRVAEGGGRMEQAIEDDAKRRFCNTHDCLMTDTAPAAAPAKR